MFMYFQLNIPSKGPCSRTCIGPCVCRKRRWWDWFIMWVPKEQAAELNFETPLRGVVKAALPDVLAGSGALHGRVNKV